MTKMILEVPVLVYAHAEDDIHASSKKMADTHVKPVNADGDHVIGHDDDVICPDDDSMDALKQQMAGLTAEVQDLLHAFKDVFPEDTLEGLPPDRDCIHTFPLEDGAAGPFEPINRLSPLELKEIERQIAELL